jgi:E2F/DP family winged-helix DNA-binding domain
MHQNRLRKRKIKDEDDYFSDEEFDYEDYSLQSSAKRKSKVYADRSNSIRKQDSDSGRLDNSLGVLTKKFVNLIQNSENKCINLNEAVDVLYK